jgi:hypothetical protein
VYTYVGVPDGYLFSPVLPFWSNNRCYIDAMLPVMLVSHGLAQTWASRKETFVQYKIPSDWNTDLKVCASSFLGRSQRDPLEVTQAADALAALVRAEMGIAIGIDGTHPDGSIWDTLRIFLPLIYKDDKDHYEVSVSCEGTCSVHGNLVKMVSKHFVNATFDRELEEIFPSPPRAVLDLATATIPDRALTDADYSIALSICRNPTTRAHRDALRAASTVCIPAIHMHMHVYT